METKNDHNMVINPESLNLNLVIHYDIKVVRYNRKSAKEFLFRMMG